MNKLNNFPHPSNGSADPLVQSPKSADCSDQLILDSGESKQHLSFAELVQRLAAPRKVRRNMGQVRGEEVDEAGEITLFVAHRKVDSKNPDWFEKKVLLSSREAYIILENAPFDNDAVYEVEEERRGGYWHWTKITKIEKGGL